MIRNAGAVSLNLQVKLTAGIFNLSNILKRSKILQTLPSSVGECCQRFRIIITAQSKNWLETIHSSIVFARDFMSSLLSFQHACSCQALNVIN